MRTVWLLASLELLGLATSCRPPSAIVGRVVDASGAPRPGVTVFAIVDRRPAAQTQSDAAGRFQLEPAGAIEAVFGLVPAAGDLGVWRPDVTMAEGALTDLGDLEVHAVSSHEAVRWLRDVGFDEQLTHAEDALTRVSGGAGGQPLVAMRQGPRTLEVFRVDDDGSPSRVLEVEGVHWQFIRTVVEADGIRLDPRGSKPVFLFSERLADGRWVVVAQRGGFQTVTAAGATTVPIESVEWVDVMTGARLLEVPVSAGASAVVLPSRGVLLEEAGQHRWFEVGAEGPRTVKADGPGELLADADTVFRLAVTAGQVRLERLEGATFQRGPDVEVGSSFRMMQSFIDGATIGVLGQVAFERVVLLRFDRRTLIARVDDLPLESAAGGSRRSYRWSNRLCDGVPGAYVVVVQEEGLRVFRASSAGLILDEVEVPVRNLSLVREACVATDRWWLAVNEGGSVRLLRRDERGVESMTLDGATSLYPVGRFAIRSTWRGQTRDHDLLDPLSSLEPRLTPFRIPAVTPLDVTDGWMLGSTFTASGSALVRARVSGASR